MKLGGGTTVVRLSHWVIMNESRTQYNLLKMKSHTQRAVL